jgi:hypothetical protein
MFPSLLRSLDGNRHGERLPAYVAPACPNLVAPLMLRPQHYKQEHDERDADHHVQLHRREIGKNPVHFDDRPSMHVLRGFCPPDPCLRQCFFQVPIAFSGEEEFENLKTDYPGDALRMARFWITRIAVLLLRPFL